MKEKRITRAELLDDHRPPGGGRPGNSVRTDAAGQDELTHFFNHSLDLLCIAGFDGYFKRLNPMWTTQLGWSLDKLEARPFLDFIHPDDREATLAHAVDATLEGIKT